MRGAPVARVDGAVSLCRVATFPTHGGEIFLSAITVSKPRSAAPQCRCLLKYLFRNLQMQASNCFSGIPIMISFTEKNSYATSGTEVPRYRKFLNRAHGSIQIPQ